MSSTASPGSTSTPWFGVSMGLLGIIVGYSVATVTPAQLTGGAPTPPLPPSGGVVPAPAPAPVGGNPIDFLVGLAEGAEFDADEMRECLDTNKYAQKVQDQMSAGSTAGINGTPGSIIVNTKTGKGYMVSGAVPPESFMAVIDPILVGQEPGADAQVATNFPPVDASKDHIKGSPNASVIIIEWSDFQCPFCSRVEPTLEQLLQKYGDDIAIVYRHFPLGFHPTAQKAAEASECAVDQKGEDGFWEFHDLMFQNQGTMP